MKANLMPEETYPDLAPVAATMARNQVRVIQTVDVLAAKVDELVGAAAKEDWDEVGRLGRKFAEQCRVDGSESLGNLAEEVVEEAARPNNAVSTKRSLIRLIGLYGRSRNRASHAAE